eukprot:gene16332-17970_t
MKLNKLKHVFATDDTITAEVNETAFAELIQFLDERSLTLVVREVKDDARKAGEIAEKSLCQWKETENNNIVQ